MLRIKALQDALHRRESELERANAQLLELAVSDPLTGLDNRRRLDERFHEMFEHAVRLKESLAVAMFDLDHFKLVNDDFGHRAGDEMLRQIGSVLRTSMREIDHVGRYGGEEFLVLLPGTAIDAAVTFAERARLRVAAHRFSFEGRPFQATISCGVASWPDPRLMNRDELLQAADDALYVAKRTGRDRVVRYASAEFTANVRKPHDQHGSGAPAGGTAIGQR
ncbi:MAG TPA: GGDEF domain-containing protein [Gemmatimonadaceae bacterium]